MNIGLRRFILIVSGVLMLHIGGLTILWAQTVDSDSDTVGVEVTWDCPLPVEPTSPPLAGPGSCPTEVPSLATATVVPGTVVPKATQGAGGSVPSVPVVSALPDTGTSPGQSATMVATIVMITAGFSAIVGGIIASRRSER